MCVHIGDQSRVDAVGEAKGHVSKKCRLSEEWLGSIKACSFSGHRR